MHRFVVVLLALARIIESHLFLAFASQLISGKDKPPNGLDNKKLQKLIDDLEWLLEMTSRHATIDTFAKKLFLTNNQTDYQKLKNLLLLFLFYEQLGNEPDQRYDTFLASILQNDVNHLPDDLTIVSWNYDFQFEIAYNEYVKADNLSLLSEIFLHSHDKVLREEGVSLFIRIKDLIF